MYEFVQMEQEKRLNEEYPDDMQLLIQEGGYISPDEHLWNDILVGIVLKKPVLLKGPSGAGKTKLAQTISHFLISQCIVSTVQ